MVAPAAVILKNERRLGVDTVCELLIEILLVLLAFVFEKDGALCEIADRMEQILRERRLFTPRAPKQGFVILQLTACVDDW